MIALTQAEIEDIRKVDLATWRWEELSWSRKLSEGFIREFQDKLDWDYICYNQNLSEDFIEEFQDKINWRYISWYIKLSENFIRKFQHKIDWKDISQFQKLSREFCFEFYDKICWLELYRRGILYKGYFNDAPKFVKLYIALNHRELLDSLS